MGNRYFHIKSPVLVFVFELFQVKVDIILHNGAFGLYKLVSTLYICTIDN